MGSPGTPKTWVPTLPHWSPDLAGPEGQAGGGQGWRALVLGSEEMTSPGFLPSGPLGDQIRGAVLPLTCSNS